MTYSSIARHFACLWVVVLFSCIRISMAQVVNIESLRLQTDSVRGVLIGDASVTLRQTDGEQFRSFQGNLTMQLKSKSYKDLWMGIVSGDYAHLDNKQIAQNHLVHVRYNRKLTKHLRWEAFTQLQTSPLIGVRSRWLGGTGPRYKVFSDTGIALYIGTLYMLEREQEAIQAVLPAYFHRISAYLSGSWRNKAQTAELSCVTYYQPSVQEFRDYRFTLQSVLAIKVTGKVSVTGNLSTNYDARPPSGFEPFTLVNTYGVRVVL